MDKKLVYFITDEEELDDLREISKQKQSALSDIIYAYNDKHGNTLPHYWGGDDSFWDFRAHLVGLGKEVYEKCILDITQISVAENYKECFDYIFGNAKDICKTKEGKELLKISLEEREIMYYRENKLKRILK